MLRLFILSPYIIAQTKTRNIKITRFSEYFGTGLPMKLSIPITLSPPDGGKALSIFSEKIMQSVIVELDTNAQLEALKKYIQDLWGKISTLKKEDAQILTANSEMNMFGAALRGHSSKSFVKTYSERNRINVLNMVSQGEIVVISSYKKTKKGQNGYLFAQKEWFFRFHQLYKLITN